MHNVTGNDFGRKELVTVFWWSSIK